MPDLSTLLAYLPDFSSWWQSLVAFAGGNLSWVLVALLMVGWILHILIIKSLVKLVFGTVWWGIKQLAYWLIWWPLSWIGYGIWAVLKWLGSLFGRGVKASGRGVKAVGRKGKNAFKHHPWYGLGGILVGIMVLHAYLPIQYSERGVVNTMLQSLLTLYIVGWAFILMYRKMFNRPRTGHRG